MKKKSVENTVELDIRENDPKDEIIDLVDPVDEYLETIETNLNLSSVDGEDLDDTLDEMLLGIDAGDNKGTPPSPNETDSDFEKTLVELFESSEAAAAKLIESAYQKEERGEDSLYTGDHLSGGIIANQKPRAQATNEKDGTDHIPESKKKFEKNLFLNLEVVKGAPARKADATQAGSTEEEPRVKSDKTNWIDSSRYYPESVSAYDRRIAAYEKKIEKLVAEKVKVQKIYEHMMGILYLEGEELKKAVATIFSKYWSLNVFPMNKAKREGFNENILIKHQNRIVIAKIKSTRSASPSHKFITQVWKDLYYSGLGARADGALIVNHDIEKAPEDRPSPYADENAEQLDDLIFIDTRVLHKLTTAVIDGDLSIEEAKKLLFKKGRVEFEGHAGGHPTK